MDETFRVEEKPFLTAEETSFLINKMWNHSREKMPSLTPADIYMPCNIIFRDSEGVPIAIGSAYTSYGNFVAESVWVDEKYRGRGLGKKLCEAMIQVARRRGCKQIVGTALNIHEIVGFWRSLGGEVFARLPCANPGIEILYINWIITPEKESK